MRPPTAFLFTLAALAALAPAAGAQVTIGPDGVPTGPESPPTAAGPEVVELTVSPAPLPVPPLKHRLIIPPEGRRPGNAASYWYRAELALSEAEGRRSPVAGPDWQRAASDLSEEPPASLTADRLNVALGVGDLETWHVLDAATEAARQSPAEWGFGVGDLRAVEFMEFLLPEFQNARSLARLIALRGRARVGRGDFGAALADAATLLRLAEDCGRGPFIIADLVGFAVHSIAQQYVIEAVIAAPGSPNLYYALTELPDPAAGLADSWEAEFDLPFRLAPWLRDPESFDWPADRWRAEWGELFRTLETVSDGEVLSGFRSELAVGALLSVQLEPARAALIEDGYDPEKLAAMPAGQVLAVRQSRAMRELIDPYRVAAAAPDAEAFALAEAAEENLKRGMRAAYGGGFGEPVPVAGLLLPALTQARLAGVRVRVDVTALRVVEALRAHAAANGAFPAALDDVTAVSVPDNPLTGGPFGYRLEGGTAVLEVVRDPDNDPANRTLRLSLRDRERPGPSEGPGR